MLLLFFITFCYASTGIFYVPPVPDLNPPHSLGILSTTCCEYLSRRQEYDSLGNTTRSYFADCLGPSWIRVERLNDTTCGAAEDACDAQKASVQHACLHVKSTAPGHCQFHTSNDSQHFYCECAFYTSLSGCINAARGTAQQSKHLFTSLELALLVVCTVAFFAIVCIMFLVWLRGPQHSPEEPLLEGKPTAVSEYIKTLESVYTLVSQ
jgi:hypothetical protein